MLSFNTLRGALINLIGKSLRQKDVRQSFETFSNEFSLRMSQEMDSMMSMMHSQINRAITTAKAERVIPEIQNVAYSMSSTGHRDTEASTSPNSQENRENASGPKIKIAKKDSRSVGDLRDTTGCGSYNDCLQFVQIFVDNDVVPVLYVAWFVPLDCNSMLINFSGIMSVQFSFFASLIFCPVFLSRFIDVLIS